jgi:hypothetical protein
MTQNNTTERPTAHKATQAMKGIVQSMNTAYKREKSKVISDTGLGGLLRGETSRLPQCPNNRLVQDLKFPRR